MSALEKQKPINDWESHIKKFGEIMTEIGTKRFDEIYIENTENGKVGAEIGKAREVTIKSLLKTIFKSYKIEITGQGTSFNGVWVTVRIHYLHPVSGEWLFHDGIGASQLQTAKGTSPADLNNINNGALSMAYPVAKTIAIKDAADHFGKLFGSDLNRKDLINYELDLTLIELTPEHPNWNKVKEAVKSGNYTIEQIRTKYNLSDENAKQLI